MAAARLPVEMHIGAGSRKKKKFVYLEEKIVNQLETVAPVGQCTIVHNCKQIRFSKCPSIGKV